MHERPTWHRIAAAATVLALAAPVWATESQVQKKEDPKAQEQAAQNAGGPEAPESAPVQKKKNCPIDNSFNTLEDLFGLVDPASALAPQGAQPAAAPATPAPAAVEWRAVAPDRAPAKDTDKPAESSGSDEQKGEKSD